MKNITTLAMVVGLSVASALAQPGPGHPGGPGGGGRPPVLPIMTALDVNKDGQLDATEIANASAVLTKTFATNSDGKISVAQLLPSRPGKTSENQMAQPPRDGKPPVPAIIHELDANADGFLDAAEVSNASAALLKLDKNADGKLSMDELHPPRPGNPGGPGESNLSMPQGEAPDAPDMQEPPPEEMPQDM